MGQVRSCRPVVVLPWCSVEFQKMTFLAFHVCCLLLMYYAPQSKSDVDAICQVRVYFQDIYIRGASHVTPVPVRLLYRARP